MTDPKHSLSGTPTPHIWVLRFIFRGNYRSRSRIIGFPPSTFVQLLFASDVAFRTDVANQQERNFARNSSQNVNCLVFLKTGLRRRVFLLLYPTEPTRPQFSSSSYSSCNAYKEVRGVSRRVRLHYYG